jgi:hypothetical protein
MWRPTMGTCLSSGRSITCIRQCTPWPMPCMTYCSVCQGEDLSVGTAVPAYRDWSTGRWDTHTHTYAQTDADIHLANCLFLFPVFLVKVALLHSVFCLHNLLLFPLFPLFPPSLHPPPLTSWSITCRGLTSPQG